MEHKINIKDFFYVDIDLINSINSINIDKIVFRKKILLKKKTSVSYHMMFIIIIQKFD